jgi:hypothetical protein
MIKYDTGEAQFTLFVLRVQNGARTKKTALAIYKIISELKNINISGVFFSKMRDKKIVIEKKNAITNCNLRDKIIREKNIYKEMAQVD